MVWIGLALIALIGICGGISIAIDAKHGNRTHRFF